MRHVSIVNIHPFLYLYRFQHQLGYTSFLVPMPVKKKRKKSADSDYIPRHHLLSAPLVRDEYPLRSIELPICKIELAASTDSQRSWEEPVAITEVQHNSESEQEDDTSEEAKTFEQIIDMAQQEPSLAVVMEIMLRLIDSSRKADDDKARRKKIIGNCGSRSN